MSSMNMDNQIINDNMNCICNGENNANSEKRIYIENEQSGIFEMDNQLSKAAVEFDDCSDQKEMILTVEESKNDDDVQEELTMESSVPAEESKNEEKSEPAKMEQNNQTDNSDNEIAVNKKDNYRWRTESALNWLSVKRYLDEPSDQMVIFSSRAYNSIISETYAKNPVETGGILLGYVLDNGFWIVTEVIPPGKSSVNKYAYFEYDTEFVNYVANRVAQQFKTPPQVLGLWHRHPASLDRFSSVDDTTNATFANKNRVCGAISALVNLDPKFRITIYHAKINGFNQVQYQKMTYEVGDELIPDEFFQLKYVAGTSKSHAVQDVNSTTAVISEEAPHNTNALQECQSNAMQNQEKSDYIIKRINITLELILILFLSVNIAIFVQNQLINPLLNQPHSVQASDFQLEQQQMASEERPLTDRQAVVQASDSQLEQQPTASEERPLTDQQADAKDWASLFEEWSKALNISDEESQATVRHSIDYSHWDGGRNPIRPDYNPQNIQSSDEVGLIDNNNDVIILKNEVDNRTHRSGYGSIDSESSSDQYTQPLIREKSQNEADVEPQNYESGLPITTADIRRVIFR